MLNLKPHGVQIGDDRRVNTPLSWEVEVHHDRVLSVDYGVNLSGIFPIDYPPPALTPSSSPSRTQPSSPARLPSAPLTATSSPPPPSPSAAQSTQKPDPARRLRPEFLAAYGTALAADAFGVAAGCGRRERDANDADAARAARFLRETWVPALARRLDALETRPVDSRQLAESLHVAGVNVRFLGLIASSSNIPYTKDLCCIEMVSRACKQIFNARMRALIIHFRSVGATHVEDETRSFTAKTFSLFLGSGEQSERFFEDRLKREIMDKFEYVMDCGVAFEDSTDYDFSSSFPCQPSKIIGFVARRKRLSGLPQLMTPQLQSQQPGTGIGGIAGGGASSSGSDATLPPPVPEDERLAYHLTRHFRSLGAKSKLARSDVTALRLAEVAAHYNATGRSEEALKYASAALAASGGCSGFAGLARAQMVEALGALQVTPAAGPDPDLLAHYEAGMAAVQWHWGPNHPVGMAL
ncbi:hypothetical protein HK405_014874, partial [Cladochytrium tenue]